jgi:ATP-dependent helicase/nuclease subunit A
LDYAEIQSMVNVLKLIDCFSQDVPLVSTLKSPIVNITDEELMDIALAFRNDGKKGNFFEAYWHYVENYHTDLQEKLVEFNNYFNKLRTLADFIGANGILQKIISENNVKGYLFASEGGKGKVARLNRFISASQENGKNLTVKEFLKKIEVCTDAFKMNFCSGDEGGAIKAMTIHGSKGLEFPVVIVCGLEREFNHQDDYDVVLCDRKYGFAVRYFDDKTKIKKETILRAVVRNNLKLERIKEEARLFYVATTRAKHSLHLIFSAKEDERQTCFKDAKKFLDFMPLSLPATFHSEGEFVLDNQTKNIRKVLIGSEDIALSTKMKENFAKTYSYLEDTALPLKYSVTSAVKEGQEERIPVYVLYDGESTSQEKGNVAHKFLEYYDFYSNEDVTSQAQRMIANGKISSLDLEKINLERIEKAINSDALSWIKDASLYREKSFLVQVPADKLIGAKTTEKVLVQGVIDLLAIKDNVAYILDYKYSALEKNSLKATYKKQLELYAYAVEKSLGIKVEKMALINLFTGDTVII